ncbi:unnamed protein product [Rotaria sp. Silwood1]|nr:unnamed protein product [Rotaria sp. Silwood1]CAF1619724.1 unnamed protein product [Rotaria sp. Silwood1]
MPRSDQFSDTFLLQLKKFINDTQVNTDVILIYTNLLQLNTNHINTDVISCIYQLLENINELDLELKQNLSIFVKLAIESNITPPNLELLTSRLNEKDHLLQSNAIQIIYYMVNIKKCTLTEKILTCLYQINKDEKVLEILELVNRIQQLPANIIEKLQFINYRNLHEDINLFNKLKWAVSHEQILLKHHFVELSNLLYSTKKEYRLLASEILQIVISKNHQIIPDQVIETIIITLQDELIYLNTLQFLNKLCQNGWKANERIIIN